jgi:hypothetical protein
MKNNEIYNKTNYSELIDSINNLTRVVANYSECCRQNNAALQNLTLSINQLNFNFGKETALGTQGPSLQLKQYVSEFVNYYINPRFYKTAQLRLVTRRFSD